MKLTQKETSLLKDLKTQEELCIEKYKRYAEGACDPCLASLFTSIAKTEEKHLQTIGKIMKGEEVAVKSSPASPAAKGECASSPLSRAEKQKDAFLCQDALSMEKHVSTLYDVSIFEFCSPVLRDTLNAIQKEEQNHGKQLYDYLAQNALTKTSVV